MAGYTLIDWHAKPGRESEFVKKWKETAASHKAQFDPRGWAVLLRDEEDPAHFVSMAEWPDVNAVEHWFASERFRQRMEQMQELVDQMTPRRFDRAASV